MNTTSVPCTAFAHGRKMADGMNENEKLNSIKVCGMQFSYEGNDKPPLFYDFSLDISPGSRCLLVGANGSGKSTSKSSFFWGGGVLM